MLYCDNLMTVRNGKSRYLATLVVALLALALRWRALLMLPADYDEPIYMQAAQHYAAAIRAADWNRLLSIRDTVEHPALVKLLYAIASPLSSLQTGRQPPLAGSVTGEQSQSMLGSLNIGRCISVFFGTLQVALLALVSPLAGFLLAIHTILTVDRRGQVWVGGDLPYGPLGAVAVFDGQRWHDYSQHFSGIRQAPVRAIAVDPQGRVWFATVLEGILVYDGSKTAAANQ